MATVKSKLKEQLQKEKDLAVDELLHANTTEGNIIARNWLDSIERVKKVCDDRNRY